MASVSKGPNGTRVIQLICGDGKRRSIRLGKATQKVAESIRARVEAIAACNQLGTTPDPSILEWIASLEDKMHDRFARVGLVQSRAKRVKQSLGQFLDDYAKSRIDIGPATRTVWGQTIRNMKAHFGKDRDIASITRGEADEFHMYLISQDLSSTTVARRLQFARQFMAAAHRRELCKVNPFAEVRAKAVSDPSRQVFVERETIDRVLEECTADWRLLIKLSRYAGLRSPSETCSLRLADINWANDSMVVQSPKTAHHGRASRVVPIFAEIREDLEAAFNRREDGSVYVLEPFRTRAMAKGQWVNANLRTEFSRIILRAGVNVWPRIWHNLRSSCETELVKRFPVHLVAAWLGHTPRIAFDHYLQVTGADFAAAAAGRSTLSGASVLKAVQPAAGNERQPLPAASAMIEQPAEKPSLASVGCDSQWLKMVPV